MYVCGLNNYSQLDKHSNNKNSLGSRVIDHPCKFHENPNLFSSFSTNSDQTVWITHDGKSYVTGDNRFGQISGSLPKKTLPEDTELNLRDDYGFHCKFISVVCGLYYTLYLVFSESNTTKFKLVYCYSGKIPNPLFVSIENRTPLALFGGEFTAGVIDDDGGIIILTDSVFDLPTKSVNVFFLPGGDKPVKLACCNFFVIALGMSGRVYESDITYTSLIKFEEVEELSNSKVVDVSGTRDFCFTVLENGRVFGRGDNSYCKLGLPKEVELVSKFTLINSLKYHKIVSVFTGTSHSIFKTSEGEMIVCGSNECGQLFIPLTDNDNNIYPPQKVGKFSGFTFCVTGSYSTSVFFSREPPNLSNSKIIAKYKTKTNDKIDIKNEKNIKQVPEKKEVQGFATKTNIKSLNENELKNEIEELKKKISEKDEEYSILIKENSNLKKENTNLKETNSNLEEQNIKHKNNLQKFEKENLELNKTIRKNSTIQIIKTKDFHHYQKDKLIRRKATSEVYEITEKRKLAMKYLNFILNEVPHQKYMKLNELDDDDYDYDFSEKNKGEVDFEQAKKLLLEYEILMIFDDDHIIKAYGIFFGDENNAPAIILEYCKSNLTKQITKFSLSKVERIQIIVDICSAMKTVHSKGIIHRDLTIDSILLDSNNRAKLCNFSHCTFKRDYDYDMNDYEQIDGNPIYMAPELLQREKDYDEKVDVYAFGVVVFVILTNGKYPDINSIEVINGKQAPIPNNNTEFSNKLIRDCWSFESRNRPSFTEICDRLKGNEHKLI